jgi:hypothetical protein
LSHHQYIRKRGCLYSSANIFEEFNGKLQEPLRRKSEDLHNSISYKAKRPKEVNPLVTLEKQKQHQMGIGILQYLDIISHPDIANSVREISKLAEYGYVWYFWEYPLHVSQRLRVTLSSTEAECYATSDIENAVTFANRLLEENGIKNQLPTNIKRDYFGVINITNNQCKKQRTKHINTCQHFVFKWIEDYILNIIFMPFLHKSADIFTKNATE